MTFSALNFGLGTHHNTSTSCLISVFYALNTIYICTCGEIGRLDILHQSFHINVRIVNIGAAAVNHFAKVMCRNVGGHAHSNTVAAIHQKVGHLGGHHRRFNERIVEVAHHVNGILVQVVHDVFTHLGESTFCITHGSWRVTVNTAKVTLTVNQRVAHVPVLGHSYQCTVN